jgi:hypothetical protein
MVKKWATKTQSLNLVHSHKDRMDGMDGMDGMDKVDAMIRQTLIG